MEEISKGREYDRVNRVLILENMAIMLRMYGRTKDEKWVERAKEFGIVARKLADRIQTHDYRKEDVWYSVVDKMEHDSVLKWHELKGLCIPTQNGSPNSVASVRSAVVQ